MWPTLYISDTCELLMTKFISVIMDDTKLDEIHAKYCNKVWYVLYPNNFVMKYCHGWLRFGWKLNWVSDINCAIVNLYSPNSLYKEWQIMLGSHLVLVTHTILAYPTLGWVHTRVQDQSSSKNWSDTIGKDTLLLTKEFILG